MRKVLGILFILVGVAAIGYGFYFDIAHLLVGGILEVVHKVKANPTADSQIVWGIVKVLLSGIGAAIGFLIAVGCWGIAAGLLGMETRRSRRRLL